MKKFLAHFLVSFGSVLSLMEMRLRIPHMLEYIFQKLSSKNKIVFRTKFE